MSYEGNWHSLKEEAEQPTNVPHYWLTKLLTDGRVCMIYNPKNYISSYIYYMLIL